MYVTEDIHKNIEGLRCVAVNQIAFNGYLVRISQTLFGSTRSFLNPRGKDFDLLHVPVIVFTLAIKVTSLFPRSENGSHT